jgi:hypothetical protein
MSVDNFLDAGYRAGFGITRKEAQNQRVCAMCKQSPTFTTEAGRKEYAISGVCEPCFDDLFAEVD